MHHCKIKRRSLFLDSSNLPEGMHPVLKRIYAMRGITEPDQLDVSLSRLHPAHLLSGIEQALRLLKDAIENRQKVLIVGDFDADGATSTALALRALRAMGATKIDYLVPNRFEYGYGLTPEIVATSLKLEPNIIMTVDNGIASVAGVAAARLQGIKIIITDHHLPGKQLPEADAIVNPNLENDPFPSKALAGELARDYSAKYAALGYSPEPNTWDEGGLFEITPHSVIAWNSFGDDPTKFVFAAETEST